MTDSQWGQITPPLLTALDLRPAERGAAAGGKGQDVFIAGTLRGDVWEIDQWVLGRHLRLYPEPGDPYRPWFSFQTPRSPRVLIHGQPRDAYGLAAFSGPKDGALFATCCDTDEVFVWDAEQKRLVLSVRLGQGLKARAVGVSPDGRLIAVGCTNGGLKVLERGPQGLDQVFWCKHSGSAIDEVKFSPCGRFLATGSHDQVGCFSEQPCSGC